MIKPPMDFDKLLQIDMLYMLRTLHCHISELVDNTLSNTTFLAFSFC